MKFFTESITPSSSFFFFFFPSGVSALHGRDGDFAYGGAPAQGHRHAQGRLHQVHGLVHQVGSGRRCPSASLQRRRLQTGNGGLSPRARGRPQIRHLLPPRRIQLAIGVSHVSKNRGVNFKCWLNLHKAVQRSPGLISFIRVNLWFLYTCA